MPRAVESAEHRRLTKQRRRDAISDVGAVLIDELGGEPRRDGAAGGERRRGIRGPLDRIRVGDDGANSSKLRVVEARVPRRQLCPIPVAGGVAVQRGPVRGDHGVRGVEVRELVWGKVVIARVRDLLVAEHRPQRGSAESRDGDVLGRHGCSMGEVRETEAVHLGREDGVGDGAALGVRGRVAPRPSRRVVLVVDERSPRAVLRAERLPHHFLRVGAGVGEDARERLDGSRVNQGPSHGFRGGVDLRGERGGIVREGPPRRDFAGPREFRFQPWPLELSSRRLHVRLVRLRRRADGTRISTTRDATTTRTWYPRRRRRGREDRRGGRHDSCAAQVPVATTIPSEELVVTEVR